jgi:hypothetical protein
MLVGLEALKLAKAEGNTEQALREEIEILRRLLADAIAAQPEPWNKPNVARWLRVLDMVAER